MARQPTLAKVGTWNINGIERRLDLLLAWLDVARPDVLALQETKIGDAGFPHAALAASGYASVATGQGVWNGVALLARHEVGDIVVSRRALPGDAGDTQPRYLEAAIGGTLFASIYLPNGNPQPGPKFDYKLRWFERLIEHAASLYASRLPVVLAGDFNVVATDLDIYEGTTSYRDNALLQPAPRAAFRTLLAQGWVDALRARHPDERIYTFWDFMRQRWPRNAGLRLDHLLLSAPLQPRLQDAQVDREVRGMEGASDHAPVWITLSAQDEAPPRARSSRPPRRRGSG
jgi:exodeoxyribonuclease-3